MSTDTPVATEDVAKETPLPPSIPEPKVDDNENESTAPSNKRKSELEHLHNDFVKSTPE